MKRFLGSLAFARLLAMVGAVMMASGFMTLGRRIEAASVDPSPTPFASFNPIHMQEVTVRVWNIERSMHGSGLVVSKDGLIATAAWLVEGAGTIYVDLMHYDVMGSGWTSSEVQRRRKARIVRVNAKEDVALLRMVDPPPDLAYTNPEEWDSWPLQSGEPVYYVDWLNDGRIEGGPVLAPMDATFSAVGAKWLTTFDSWFLHGGEGGAPVFDTHGIPVGLMIGYAMTNTDIKYVVPLETIRKLMRP